MYDMTINIPPDVDSIRLLNILRKEGFKLFYKNIYLGELTPIAHGTEKVIRLNKNHIQAMKSDIKTPPYHLLKELEKYDKIGLTLHRPYYN